MSPLTNVIYRYWKGTDRDAWTVERDKAARYPDLENAERELAACLVREYRNVSVIKYD